MAPSSERALERHQMLLHMTLIDPSREISTNEAEADAELAGFWQSLKANPQRSIWTKKLTCRFHVLKYNRTVNI